MFVTLQDCLNVQTFLNFPLFLKKNKGDDTPSVRLQPLSAKDVLLTKYLYLGDFTYEDVKQIVHKIDALKKKTSLQQPLPLALSTFMQKMSSLRNTR